tara:strand:- start:1014 stop:1820 length:807 start_codon:yes stop_codon:yes gene_type:complete
VKTHIKNINKKGFTVIPEVFDKDVCDFAKDLSDKYIDEINLNFDNHQSQSSLANKIDEKVLLNIQNKNYFYLQFISNKKICDLIGYFLQKGSYKDKEPYHLINTQVRCLKPFSRKQQLHLDSNLPGKGGFPLVMVAIIMLDDFNQDNGATRVVQQSHLRGDYALPNKKYKNEQNIFGKAGDVIILNGALWHGSEENKTNNERWSINIGYGRWFIKPSFDIARSLKKDTYLKMNKFERELIGLKTVPPISEFQRVTRKSENDFLNWEET